MGTHGQSQGSRVLLRWAGHFSVAALLIACAACSGPPPNPNPRAAVPLQTVPVDLQRYMGRWYVIANIPYFGERGNVGSYAEWALRPDGRIDDAYVYRPGGFEDAQQILHFIPLLHGPWPDPSRPACRRCHHEVIATFSPVPPGCPLFPSEYRSYSPCSPGDR